MGKIYSLLKFFTLILNSRISAKSISEKILGAFTSDNSVQPQPTATFYLNRKLHPDKINQLPLGILENTFLTHHFVLRDVVTDQIISLFGTYDLEENSEILQEFQQHFSQVDLGTQKRGNFGLYMDYLDADQKNSDNQKSGSPPPKIGLKFMYPQFQSKFGFILNDPDKISEILDQKKIKTEFKNYDLGYTVSIKNAVLSKVDAFWVNYSGELVKLGRHRLRPAPIKWCMTGDRFVAPKLGL